MVERSHTAGLLPNIYGPLRKLGEKVADWFAPKADAAVAPDFYEISLELPGVSPDEIEVSVQDETLTVQGEKHFEREEQGKSYFFSEREYGAFQRSFRLPPDASADRVDAAFRNGVLTITIPKLRAAQQDIRKVVVRAE
ncbi:MAG: Hsp20/alpha crystallin family protein [Hyphomicrobiaceae bacterium]|nr:MAG: Hsp20/alpha crystallin family protein [Hyphomicrobiaceae bacterium]